MSEREIPESDLTRELKAAYGILKKQGVCYGSWWHGKDDESESLCLEGVLQKSMGISYPINPTLLYVTPVYKFIQAEAKSSLDKIKIGVLARLKARMLHRHLPAHTIDHMQNYHFRLDLHHYNDSLGWNFVFPLMERCVAKSEAMDRQESARLLEEALV